MVVKVVVVVVVVVVVGVVGVGLGGCRRQHLVTVELNSSKSPYIWIVRTQHAWQWKNDVLLKCLPANSDCSSPLKTPPRPLETCIQTMCGHFSGLSAAAVVGPLLGPLIHLSGSEHIWEGWPGLAIGLPLLTGGLIP